MTLDEFLDAFREAHKRRPFRVRKDGRIRHVGFCPLEVVGNVSRGGFMTAARKIGLSDEDAMHVVHGADFVRPDEGPRAELRARMLAIMAEPHV